MSITIMRFYNLQKSSLNAIIKTCAVKNKDKNVNNKN
jgi:hypothetical protein